MVIAWLCAAVLLGLGHGTAPETASTWAQALSTSIHTLFEDSGYTTVKAGYDDLDYSVQVLDGVTLVDDLAASLAANLDSKAAALQAIAQAVQAAYVTPNVHTASVKQCCQLNAAEVAFSDAFKTDIATNRVSSPQHTRSALFFQFPVTEYACTIVMVCRSASDW